MTDSKTPDWVKEEALQVYASVCDAEPISSHCRPITSQALLSAYERGRKEGIEEAAKVIEKETEAPAQRNSKSMWVQDIGDRLATAIRQLLGVKG